MSSPKFSLAITELLAELEDTTRTIYRTIRRRLSIEKLQDPSRNAQVLELIEWEERGQRKLNNLVERLSYQVRHDALNDAERTELLAIVDRIADPDSGKK